MRSTFIGFIMAAAVVAAPWAAAGAADLAHLRSMAGRYTHEVLADPALDVALRTALGADFAALEEVTSVVFPTELIDDRFLVATGCMQHACGTYRGLVLIDVDTGALMVLRSDEQTAEALAGGTTELSPAAESYVAAWLP